MVWVSWRRAATGGHGWVAAAACSTLAPWQSEQLWQYQRLISLDVWTLHSGAVHHPRKCGSTWQRWVTLSHTCLPTSMRARVCVCVCRAHSHAVHHHHYHKYPPLLPPTHLQRTPAACTTGARSLEEALVHVIVEARRAAPAVLFLPHIQVSSAKGLRACAARLRVGRAIPCCCARMRSAWPACQATPACCACAMRLGAAPGCCACALRLCAVPVCCACVLCLCVAPVCCARVLRLCTAPALPVCWGGSKTRQPTRWRAQASCTARATVRRTLLSKSWGC